MNFFGKILKNCRLFERYHYRLGKNSATDWLLIVLVFVGLVVIFIALAFYQFSNYQKSDRVSNRTAVATSTTPLLYSAKLDAVVKYIIANEQKFKELKVTPARFVDPSR